VQEGNVVTVEYGIMHEPKASALSARDQPKNFIFIHSS